MDRAVRWVHISELNDPTPWLSGGELLLTTGLQLDDERAYIARLVEHGLTGLGFGVGFAHSTVPEALREAAAEHGFPLFEVPYELPFIAITEKAFSHLVNEQYSVLRRALTAHERLERVVLSERGLEGVASELAAMIDGPALIFDGRGELLARRGEAPVGARSPPSCASASGRAGGAASSPAASHRARWRCRSRAERPPAAATLRCPRRG